MNKNIAQNSGTSSLIAGFSSTFIQNVDASSTPPEPVSVGSLPSLPLCPSEDTSCTVDLPLSGGARPPLGNIDEVTGQKEPVLSIENTLKKNTARSLLFELQGVASEIMPDKRLKGCCRIPLSPWLDVMRSNKGYGSYIKGFLSCGKKWICPVCGQKIAVAKAEELKHGISLFTDISENNAVFMLTFTNRHNRRHRLHWLLSKQSEAMKIFYENGSVKRIFKEYGLVGRVNSFELTYGLLNGWHPHYHCLLFMELGKHYSKAELVALWKSLQKCLYPYWKSAAKKVGLSVNFKNGLSVVGGNHASDYCNKLHTEMTLGNLTKSCKSNSKNLTVFQMYNFLYSFPEDDRCTLYKKALLEFYLAIQGKNLIRWSPGLRGYLGMSKEKTDDELARLTDEDLRTILQINSDDYYGEVRKNNRLSFEIRKVADLGKEQLIAYLNSLNIRYREKNRVEDWRVEENLFLRYLEDEKKAAVKFRDHLCSIFKSEYLRKLCVSNT